MSQINTEQYLEMYRDMVRIRAFEFALELEHQAGNVPGMLHPSTGHEATQVAIARSLGKEDAILPDHRCHGLIFLKGTPGDKLMAELFGKATGQCGGKAGSLHIADAEVRNFGVHGVIGATMAAVLGVAFAMKRKTKDNIAAVIIGDGASGRGEWHESLNMASTWKLPVLYCCVNNQYAISVAVEDSHATGDLYEFAQAYKMPSVQVDGNDLTAAYNEVQKAVEYIRARKGPYFIEFKTWRWQGTFFGELRDPEEVK